MKKMPYKDPFSYSWARELLIVIMTLLGSIASYAYKIINGEKFSLWMFIAQALVSVFAGSFVFLAASYFQWAPEYAGGIAGIAGWSGAEFVKTIERKFKRKLGDE
ncbi:MULTISPECIES: phage holin family protein [Providencia]|nr:MULTISPECIES: phage holin family protein [Providencia]MCB4826701.1 phage holin family protein [Providencia rettgeri]MCB4843259.1 phage holin family protein [Providencia rettgeri]MCG5278209.1 phage holin family protein [Providencia rettgeri]MCG5384966.1 phage holin family protein [Providencia rettgeri]MCG9509478.1 phage holin family protein [Providencia rettgeri]